VPLADAETGDYIDELQKLLQKATLFVPFGVLIVAAARPPVGMGRVAAGAAVGAFAAVVLEFGQVMLPRYPSVTDVVLGAAAAFGGAAVARRVRGMEAR
jgi:VanZ family protein